MAVNKSLCPCHSTHYSYIRKPSAVPILTAQRQIVSTLCHLETVAHIQADVQSGYIW